MIAKSLACLANKHGLRMRGSSTVSRSSTNSISCITQGARQCYDGDTAVNCSVAADMVREVAKAGSLYDEIETLVQQRVPSELAARLEKMQQTGGAAPPPRGMILPEALAAQVAAAARAAAGLAGGDSGGGVGTHRRRNTAEDVSAGAGAGGNQRASARLRGSQLPALVSV